MLIYALKKYSDLLKLDTNQENVVQTQTVLYLELEKSLKLSQ